MRAARRGIRGVVLNSKEELRAHQKPLERALNTSIESAFGVALSVERHRALDICIGNGVPVSAALESREDVLCTRYLFRSRYRPAHKDALTGL